MTRPSTVSLCFRGFELTPDQVQDLVGVVATGLGVKGGPAKPGVSSILKRSYALYEVQFPTPPRLGQMITALFDHLGGIDHLCSVREQVRPEYLDLSLLLPVKGSEEQESGSIDPPLLADITRLSATLSFAFV